MSNPADERFDSLPLSGADLDALFEQTCGPPVLPPFASRHVLLPSSPPLYLILIFELPDGSTASLLLEETP